MSQLLDLISGHLGDENVDRISRSLGADRSQTEKAIAAALPTLLGAVTRNASDEGGQQNLHNALVRDHDGSVFDHLGSLLGGAKPESSGGMTQKTTSGGAILDHILGGKRQRVEQGVSSVSGLDSRQSSDLMSMLAPILMGAIGKRRKQDDLSAGGLGDLLRGEREQVEAPQSSGGSLIGRMLDQDGDGDFDLFDVMKFGLGRVFGKK
ncbi:MAG: DUF937 domain-containing protein [Planctomycetota bacterium]